jgi:hypothetical protein
VPLGKSAFAKFKLESMFTFGRVCYCAKPGTKTCTGKRYRFLQPMSIRTWRLFGDRLPYWYLSQTPWPICIHSLTLARLFCNRVHGTLLLDALIPLNAINSSGRCASISMSFGHPSLSTVVAPSFPNHILKPTLAYLAVLSTSLLLQYVLFLTHAIIRALQFQTHQSYPLL